MFHHYRKTKIGVLTGLLAVILVACSPANSAGDGTDSGPPATEVERQATAANEDKSDEAADEVTATATREQVEEDRPKETVVSEKQDKVAGTSDNEPTKAEEDGGTVARVTNKGGTEILTDDNRTEIMRDISADWNTDWNRHTVPYDELVPVLRRDGIRSLDNPKFESVEDASLWMSDREPVMALELNGEARAYPLRILTAHEIVNDRFGDLPVTVTYCPLCNSAIVFDARFDGRELAFGTSGWLRHSDLIMYDRTTETLWQQFTGEGIVGEYAGERLTFLPSSLVSFNDFAKAFPQGRVLSRDTGFLFPYNFGSYSGYDSGEDDPFLFFGELDDRLPTMERVVSISLENVDIAYPVSKLAEVSVINDVQDGQELVLLHSPGTTSAFYNPVTDEFTDVGATGIFNPNLNGELLTFSKRGNEFVDDQTGSSWNILGQATDGPLAGEVLEPVVHGDHFWFSWAAFKPDTLIYGG